MHRKKMAVVGLLLVSASIFHIWRSSGSVVDVSSDQFVIGSDIETLPSVEVRQLEKVNDINISSVSGDQKECFVEGPYLSTEGSSYSIHDYNSKLDQFFVNVSHAGEMGKVERKYSIEKQQLGWVEEKRYFYSKPFYLSDFKVKDLEENIYNLQDVKEEEIFRKLIDDAEYEFISGVVQDIDLVINECKDLQ